MNWLEQSRQLQTAGRSFAIATIVAVKGSTARNTGVHMLVEQDGSLHGTIGGGSVEKNVIQQCLQAISDATPRLTEYLNDGEEGRPICGGKLQVFIEPFVGHRQLYIFGGGHVGIALAHVMAPSDFSVTIIDERDDYPRLSLPGVRVIHASFDTLPPELIFTEESTHIVVVTFGHERDLQVVRNCLQHPWRYLGMIASKAKAKQLRQILHAEGVDPVRLEKMVSPIGLPGIGSKDPAEIAISIAAQLLEQNE